MEQVRIKPRLTQLTFHALNIMCHVERLLIGHRHSEIDLGGPKVGCDSIQSDAWQ